VNETAVQNVWRHNFLQPGALSEVGETVAHIWPQVVHVAAYRNFTKIIDSSQPPCGTYMAYIFRRFHAFDLKSQRKNGFYKQTSSINENRLKLEDYIIFANLSFFMISERKKFARKASWLNFCRILPKVAEKRPKKVF
jgi:hypothetical protein